MIRKKLEKLAELSLYTDNVKALKIENGLYTGLMGLAIFNLEYYKYSKEEKYYDSGMRYLEQIIISFREIQLDTFCSGISDLLFE